VERHRAAQINVAFDATANQTQRREALKLIGDALRERPEGVEGKLFEQMPKGLESAEIRHFPTISHGPFYYTDLLTSDRHDGDYRHQA
jgi:hypothetical protein